MKYTFKNGSDVPRVDCYAPRIGYWVSYPFDCGMAQNGPGKNEFCTAVGWVREREITAEEACLLTDYNIPANKVATVVSMDEKRVSAVYRHDGKFWLIAHSFENVLQDALRRGLAVHDILTEIELWSCPELSVAMQLAEESCQILNKRLSTQFVPFTPYAVPPRWQPYSGNRIFIPAASISIAAEVFFGKVAFNRYGEPVGIWTGETLLDGFSLAEP